MKLLSLFCMLAGGTAVLAQDTPTEKTAAKEVLRKMAELEKSLDVPALVAKLTAANPEREQVVARARQLMDTDLLKMGDEITKDPEIGFQEQHAVEKLTKYLQKHNFETETGIAGLRTAFVGYYKRNPATTKDAGPNLGIILEYDALRGTKGAFHGDQHSTQGPIGMAVAIAVAEYLEQKKLPGNVYVFGTPAEEMMPPPSKTVMTDAGVFKGMDILVRSHCSQQTSRPAPGFGTCCLNIDGVRYVFGGAPAHQMTAWNGRNALEGVVHLFENIDSIRANIRPEARIQGIIPEGGAAPNVVPDRAVGDFYIRYPDEVYLKQVTEMVDNAARGAALSTGTKVKIEHYGNMRDGISEATLAEVAFAYLKLYGAKGAEPLPGKPQGFEETGSVSRLIPGIGFSAKTSNSANHTYEMESDAMTAVGHDGFVTDAQAMTALLYDFATRPEFRSSVKQEFSGLQGLFAEYLESLQKAYVIPKVDEPK